jgi:uncharacterized protein (TIGR02466 family)
MNLVNTLNIPFFEFVSEPKLADEIFSILENDPFEFPNAKNKLTDMTKHFYHEKLFDWFDDCLSKVHTKLSLVDTITLEIIACWGNRSKKLEGHHQHSHTNSFISGVYYPVDHDTEIVFSYPDIWFKQFPNLTLCKIKKDAGESTIQGISNFGTYKPKKGHLILFPSHITHKTNIVTDQNTRYSIAFNVFFKGKLGDTLTAEMIMNPVTVRERNTK